jgi:hypothetical protein
MLCLSLLVLLSMAAKPSEFVARTVSYAKCTGISGSTNTSDTGAGTDIAHTLTCTFDLDNLDKGILKANSVIDAFALVTLTTSTPAPRLQFKLKAGAITLVENDLFFPADNDTINYWIAFKTIVRAAPGASVNTDSSFLASPAAASNAGNHNNTAQPIPLNTLTDLVWTFVSRWESDTGPASTVALNVFLVQVTN